MAIKRNIRLAERRQFSSIDVVFGSELPIELTVTDFSFSASAVASCYARPKGSDDVFETDCTVSGSTITVNPVPGFFQPGRNEMQVDVTDGGKTVVTFLMAVNCDGSMMDGIPEVPETARSFVERAQEIIDSEQERINAANQAASNASSAASDARNAASYANSQANNAASAASSAYGAASAANSAAGSASSAASSALAASETASVAADSATAAAERANSAASSSDSAASNANAKAAAADTAAGAADAAAASANAAASDALAAAEEARGAVSSDMAIYITYDRVNSIDYLTLVDSKEE